MKKFLSIAIIAAAAANAGAVSFDDLAVTAAELRLTAAEAPAAATPPVPEPVKLKIGVISKAERKEYITRAETWRPETKLNTAAIDFKTGPYGKMKYAPEELVTCGYVPMKEAYDEGRPNGTTRKFKCRDAKGKEFKVKYGSDNGELMTEVASSWIMTAIGAYADRMYPVRLNCPDCPSDPFKDESDRGAWTQGQMVVIEDKIGERMEYKPNSGIGFDEFHLMNDRVGAEALSGLAHFLGNSDNKAPNQAIACQKDDVVAGPGGKAVCAKPVAYMQDMGISFGGHKFYHNSRMDFDRWAKEKIWDDPRACVMNLKATHTSSINGTDHSGRDMHQIGEQARQLLITRLSLLSRQQLTDIFTAARAPLREPRHSAGEWADLFLSRVEKLRSPMGAKTPAGFACPYSVVPPNSAPQPDPFGN
ncbi:MAG: hypothetical protein A2179_03580 [Elusimicrobia bacterium GWC2_63_65]|nr:MAG: hypothetical protein A2179_03580 [Elusimicrobia bacterium GWC2_63_65]